MSGNSERKIDVPRCSKCDRVPSWWEILTDSIQGRAVWIYNNDIIRNNQNILKGKKYSVHEDYKGYHTEELTALKPLNVQCGRCRHRYTNDIFRICWEIFLQRIRST